MDTTLTYSEIIKKTLHEATQVQPRLQPIRLYPVCDMEIGQFLVIATGWDKQKWVDSILFHARLQDNKVVIEEDNWEEGLTNLLIQNGIKTEDILASESVAIA